MNWDDMKNGKWEIAITVDHNDGDHATALNSITLGQINRLRPVFEMIKNFKPYSTVNGKIVRELPQPDEVVGDFYDVNTTWTHDANWPTGDCQREDLGEKEPHEIYDISEDLEDEVNDFCPSCQYGFHTIVRVEIYKKPEKERLV